MTLPRHIRRFARAPALLTASALLSAAVAAQDLNPLPEEGELLDEPEEVRYYSVEVIVFEYQGAAAGSGEIFLPDEIPVEDEAEAESTEDVAVFGDATTLGDAETLFPDPVPVPEIDPEDVPLVEIIVPGQVEMFPLHPDEYSLVEIYERLSRLDAYKPLLHGGWTQATADRDVAPPIRLRVLGNAPLHLDGNLTLYLSRYLHLVVDLTMDDVDSTMPQYSEPGFGEVATYGDERTQNNFGYAPIDTITPPIRFRIFEDRIVKNGDLRYFDHPKFGVLAKVARYEPPLLEMPYPDETEPMRLPGPIE